MGVLNEPYDAKPHEELDDGNTQEPVAKTRKRMLRKHGLRGAWQKTSFPSHPCRLMDLVLST